jgi:glutamine cyclotransferase
MDTRRTWIAALLLAPALLGGGGLSAPVDDFVVLGVIDHDARAFTQGLAVDGEHLIESTGGYGESTLRRLDLASGRILAMVELPAWLFGEGTAVFGQHIIQLTWRAGIGLVYDRSSLELLRTFRYDGEGWGLTHDGTHLIMSDGSSRLHFHDPHTYARLHSLQVTHGGRPVRHLNELEYVGGEIYANVWQTNRIARISADTGAVLGWLDLTRLRQQRANAPEQVPNGIAYDQQRGELLVGGKLWDRLYRIQPTRRAAPMAPRPDSPN